MRVTALVLALMLAAGSAAGAQSPGRVYRIGALETGVLRPNLWDTFRQQLRELGYVEGQNVTFEMRAGEGRNDRLPALAAELVRLKVDVIVTAATPAALAAKNATRTVPVVMATGADPVGAGVVASLARPGGNVTGMTTLSSELSGKRLELARQLTPPGAPVGLLWNPTSAVDRITVRETETAARVLGVELRVLGVSAPKEFDAAIAALAKDRVGAVLLSTSPLFFAERRALMALAAQHRMPTIFAFRQYAEAGGLISYGPILPELFRRAALYVDRILKGAKPGDLPIEQPTTFELVINLKAAKTLGVTIPQSLLLRADQVIQ